jgi:uncharacterized membrane protein
MIATDITSDEDMQAGNGYAARRGTEHGNSVDERLAKGLGWFSIGLGVAEVVAPGPLARFIGIRDEAKTRAVLRGYGMRELAAGIGILTQPRPAGWMWSRVAGDVMDLSSLASALSSDTNNRGRLAAVTAAVAGITALDALCGQRLSDSGSEQDSKKTKVTKSIVVDRSPEEAYRFWRDFKNLPTFMTYLESVENKDDRRSHWVAVGPAGVRVEWDAELLLDEPNRLIAWRSLPGAVFANAGSVGFEKAPDGRGTLVRVVMDYAPNGGVVKPVIGKVLGMDLGQRIFHDLRNFKQMMEIGEVTKSDASIHEGMHAAQPPEVQPA